MDRASSFHRATDNKARAAGLPWNLISHEDVVVLRGSRPGPARPARDVPGPALGWLSPLDTAA